MAKSLDFDAYYVCPDCGEEVQGYELQNFGDEEVPYVCPKCGCVQEVSEVEAQLGYDDEEEE